MAEGFDSDRIVMSIRVPTARKRELEKLAKAMGTTVSAQVNMAIARYVDACKRRTEGKESEVGKC